MTTVFLLALIGLGVWLALKWQESRAGLERLERRLDALETRLARTGGESAPEAGPALPPTVQAGPAATGAAPPPLPSSLLVNPPDWLAEGGGLSSAPAEVSAPPVCPPVEPVRVPAVEAVGSGPSETKLAPGAPAGVGWESLLGVKLFAWVGGLALFLGVAFFVKYSFEHNLIRPAMRVAIGYAVGLGLLGGAWWLPRPRHLVTVQSLTATGVVVLYAATFAAQAHYGFLGLLPAFVIMSGITVLAFLLAIRLAAQGVAVLGWLGGFLTPWLLSTGQDNPAGLFGYVALLDAGLLAVALRQRWTYLAALAAAATALMQFAWVARFFADAKTVTAMTVFTGFAALFVGAFGLAQRQGRVDRWITAAAAIPPVAGWLFSLYLHLHPAAAGRVGLMLGFILVLGLGFLAMGGWRAELRTAPLAAGLVVFVLLMLWTVRFLTLERLNGALLFYLLFAFVHGVAPLALEWRRWTRLEEMAGSDGMASGIERGGETAAEGVGGGGVNDGKPWAMAVWLQWFPALALALILVPLFRIAGPSVWVWPVVLFIDALVIGLALLGGSLAALLVVVLMTALGAAAWIFQLPAELPGVTGMLTVVGGFSIFFAGAAFLAGPRLTRWGSEGGVAGAATREQFGVAASLAGALPFLLLTLVVVRLPLENPWMVFGLAGGLSAMLLGMVAMAKRDGLDLLGLTTLGGVLMLEHVWHLNHFNPDHWPRAVVWSAGFGTLFFAFPFVFHARLAGRVLPWVTSALAWPLHFLLFHWAINRAHPEFAYPGLVPLVLAGPGLGALGWLALREQRPELAAEHSVLTRRALFGGAALFFITLVFPIQFERHWVTLGWALEGVALLGLFHRVPHPGLRTTGVGLLVAAFVRLALNPLVIVAYERSGARIWNWYLYTYGLVAACLLAGGWLLAPPRHRVLNTNAPPVLFTLGTVLLFLLVNIEIADYFSPPGRQLVFEFSGRFAQDMTYTLAWALFASGLMAVGFRRRHAAARFAGMGLLLVTLMKLFLHDLWRLGGLHRIGSLVGLAVVLILVSFVYQRFLSSGSTSKPGGTGGNDSVGQ